jgi:hypothetical protein
MILRRLKTHIEKENWFAVGIDFCIVVIGVFIGIQVANWNAAQNEKREAQDYIVRLHEDVISLIETRHGLINDRQEGFLLMNEAAKIIVNGKGDSFTPQHCARLVYNTSVSNPTDDLGTLLELQTSGQLNLFKDADLKTALQNYLLARARSRDSQNQISRLVEPLYRLHPDLISVEQATNAVPGQIQDGIFSCDLDGMRASSSFKNDLDGAQTYMGLHVMDNARISESLTKLHAVLDKNLGIMHDEDTHK